MEFLDHYLDWPLRRLCNGSFCDYTNEALRYNWPTYHSCTYRTHWRFSAGNTANKVALIIQIVIYILLAILSIFGFVIVSFLSCHCSHSPALQFGWSYFTKARIHSFILLDGLRASYVEHWLGCIRYCSQLQRRPQICLRVCQRLRRSVSPQILPGWFDSFQGYHDCCFRLDLVAWNLSVKFFIDLLKLYYSWHFISLGACSIVHSYSRQLVEEQAKGTETW